MEIAPLPLFAFAAAAVGLSVAMLAAGGLIGPRRTSKVKEMPYESGMDPILDARRRFDVRFHLVAIAFLLFDVELLFLYPWAVASRDPQGIDLAVSVANSQSGVELDRLLIFSEVMFFIALLTAGLVYIWRRGVFQWR